MTPILLLGGLLILGVPGWTRKWRGHPAHWARRAMWTQIIGLCLVEAGLLLMATPALLQLVGAADLALICRRMLGGLAPGGWAGGVAGGLAILTAAVAASGAGRVIAAQRRLRVEEWLGAHHQRGDHSLVLLPADDLIAYTIGGRSPQVVVSRGMADAVGRGVEAVVAHEEVHARQGHHRFLIAIGAVEAVFGWYPPARRSAEMTRLALERWADEESAETIGEGRTVLRRALLAVTAGSAFPEVASFGAADMIVERVNALSQPTPRSGRLWLAAGYTSAGLGVAVAFGWLAWAGWMSILAMVDPALCVR